MPKQATKKREKLYNACKKKRCAAQTKRNNILKKKARAQAYLAMGGATKKKPYEQWAKMDAEWYHLNRKKTKCLKKKCDTKEYLQAEKNFNKAEKKKCPKSLPREERWKCTPPVDPIYDKLDAENSLCYKKECEKERNAVEKIDKEIDSVAAAKRDFYNSDEGKQYALAKLKKLQPKVGKIVEQALKQR